MFIQIIRQCYREFLIVLQHNGICQNKATSNDKMVEPGRYTDIPDGY